MRTIRGVDSAGRLMVVAVRRGGYGANRGAASAAQCRTECRDTGHRTQNRATSGANSAAAQSTLLLRCHIRAGRYKKKHGQDDFATG